MTHPIPRKRRRQLCRSLKLHGMRSRACDECRREAFNCVNNHHALLLVRELLTRAQNEVFDRRVQDLEYLGSVAEIGAQRDEVFWSSAARALRLLPAQVRVKSSRQRDFHQPGLVLPPVRARQPLSLDELNGPGPLKNDKKSTTFVITPTGQARDVGAGVVHARPAQVFTLCPEPSSVDHSSLPENCRNVSRHKRHSETTSVICHSRLRLRHRTRGLLTSQTQTFL